MFSPALIVLLPIHRFPNKLAPNVPNNTPTNPPYCSDALFSIISLTTLITKQDSLRDYC